MAVRVGATVGVGAEVGIGAAVSLDTLAVGVAGMTVAWSVARAVEFGTVIGCGLPAEPHAHTRTAATPIEIHLPRAESAAQR